MQSLLGLEDVKASDVDHLTKLSNLTHLELGDCSSVPEDLLNSLTSLKSLVNLRIERAPHLGVNLGELRLLQVLCKNCKDIQWHHCITGWSWSVNSRTTIY